MTNVNPETGEVQEILTAAEVVEKLIPIYTEIEMLGVDAKEILTGAKEAGLPSTMLGKIAKAKALQKLEDLQETTAELLDLIESLE